MGVLYPFQDVDLSLIERVKDLIGRLTLEEKAGLVSSNQVGIERLDISEWHVGCEIARGYVGRSPEEPSTVLPQPIGMAAMFDPDLMYQLGELAGNETRVYYQKERKGKLMLFGPTVDMERDPRWGRTEEAYGEDPYLTGKMSAAFTKGLKGEDPFYIRTVPGLKHFCANNNERERGSCSANLEPRTKHEYYYKAFRPAITEGGAISVMAAYNEISGVPALLNPDLKTVLKDQWGLDFVVSDGADFVGNVKDHEYIDNHVDSIALAIRAGADIMLDDAEVVRWSVLEAIGQGKLKEEELDESITRVLQIRFRLGEFDGTKDKNPYSELPTELINCDKYKELNKQAAKEQVILLKNEGLLPIKKETIKKIAVLGPLADKNYMDWYTGYSDYNVSVFEGIKKYLGEEQVLYENAYDQVVIKSKGTGKYLSVKDDENVFADSTDKGLAETFEYHDWDFGSQNLFSLKNKKFLKEDEGIKASGHNTFEWFVREWLKFKEYKGYFTENNDYLINTWNDLHLITDSNARVNTTDTIKITDDKLFTKEVQSDGITRAVKLAKEAEVAIVCVGNDPLQVARECYDRPDLILPKHQSDLIKAVYEANPNTVVIIVSSYPYAVNWENANIPAMLFTSHAGPELGAAIADVLFGNYNPAGRTPLTWYKSVHDLPDIMDYDIIKNDMTYLYYKEKPLYPFGYGLSYSKFRYQTMSVETLGEIQKIKNPTILRVVVDVMNDSQVDGEEVVQLYFHKNKSRVKRPLRQLCGFKRVFMKAGEVMKVEFLVKYEDLEFYDVTRECFCLEDGEYTFVAGGNCLDVALIQTVAIEGDIIPPQVLSEFTPAINYDDKAGVEMRFDKATGLHYLHSKGMGHRWLKFGTVELTGATQIEINAATMIGKAKILIYLDSFDEQPIGSMEIPVTGGPTIFRTIKEEIQFPQGVHDVYLVMEPGISILNLRLLRS